ncbi:MAG: hypothetical protein LQ337_008960, partial [Flavoplaca oasis]
MQFSLSNILLDIFILFPTIAYALPSIGGPQIPSVASPPNTSINDSNNVDCHGSLWCSLYGGHFITAAYHLATERYPNSPAAQGWTAGPINDTAFYATGTHAVCIPLV